MRRYRLQQAGITLLGAALIVLVFWMLTGSGRAISETQRNKDHAHAIAEQLRAAGHPEDHPVILACQEWWRSEDAKEKKLDPSTAPLRGDPRDDQKKGTGDTSSGADAPPQGELPRSGKRGWPGPSPQGEGFVTEEARRAWPVAAEVWSLLRRSGLSEACCAGVIGNMAAECGGGTLELLPYTYASGYYGLCMWSLYYFPEADGLSVPDQVQLLLDTLESNIRAGGGSLSDFHACADARSAARYFSDYYERPAAWSETRANAAEAALREFGGAT